VLVGEQKAAILDALGGHLRLRLLVAHVGDGGAHGGDHLREPPVDGEDARGDRAEGGAEAGGHRRGDGGEIHLGVVRLVERQDAHDGKRDRDGGVIGGRRAHGERHGVAELAHHVPVDIVRAEGDVDVQRGGGPVAQRAGGLGAGRRSARRNRGGHLDRAQEQRGGHREKDSRARP
jgi:hypothetical protein